MGKYRIKIELEYELDVPSVNYGTKGIELLEELPDNLYNKIAAEVYETINNDRDVCEGITSIELIDDSHEERIKEITDPVIAWCEAAYETEEFGKNIIAKVRILQMIADEPGDFPAICQDELDETSIDDIQYISDIMSAWAEKKLDILENSY